MPERYQREIEEILKQSGDLGGKERERKAPQSIWRLVLRSFGRSLGGRAWSISPGRVMLAAAVLLLLAFVLRFSASGLVAPLAWAGLLLFIVGYAMFFLRPAKVEKHWRGRSLEEDSWWNRFRKKLK
jgi:VIT1/CCC1 family predicted Fe2+/Mn2+ transporter